MTANEIDHALAAAPDEIGPLLLAATEDQWFDRKSAKVAPRDLAHPLVAFANAEGGTLVIGLSKGRVEGMAATAEKINDLRQAPIDFTVPPVRSSFEVVDCVNSHDIADSLLIVRVDPSERVHETHNGECYLRVGDESRKLTYAQRRELEFDKGQSQYVGHAAGGVTIDDLDAGLLEDYRRSTGAQSEVERLLTARSLLTRQGEVTNAGYLLFARQPQILFPQALIRVVKFLSTERGTGSRLAIEEGQDHRIEGPIPSAIHEANELITGLVPRRRSLAESGRFEGHPIVPHDAWLEGLVNAVIHRSYSMAGDHIRVEIYPNRIEIESPGRFPGLADPASPTEISRFARNPRIARVCADLRIGQELGEGIRRIFEEMRRVGLTDPIYRQTQGSVRLTLTAVARLDPRTAARLPRGSQDVLDALRAAARPLSTGDLMEELPVSRPTLTRRLRALESEGLVRWVGKSPRDPRAAWILTDD